MKGILKIFDWYLKASLHVGLASGALVGVTYFYAEIPININLLFYVFFATVVSYNFIKYTRYIYINKKLKSSLKAIICLTLICFIAGVYLFFQFQIITQVFLFVAFLLNILYAIPLKSGMKNLRNFAGVKIYIVSFCWAWVTLIIPLIEANLPLDYDVLIKFTQRFLLTIILLLIFEIRDLNDDDKQLKTVPQMIGISNTKTIVYFLSIVFYVLDFFKKGSYLHQEFVNAGLVFTIAIFTYYVSPQKNKYYTLFLVESIPIFWWMSVYFL